MKDCKFKSLIIDMYEKSKNNKFFGMLYSPISTDSFSQITDIKGYMDIANPDMLLLHSVDKSNEVEIYEWMLQTYKIEGDMLFIKLRDSEIEFYIG